MKITDPCPRCGAQVGNMSVRPPSVGRGLFGHLLGGLGARDAGYEVRQGVLVCKCGLTRRIVRTPSKRRRH